MRVSVGDCRLYVDVEGLGLVPEGPAMRERPTLVALHGGPGADGIVEPVVFGVSFGSAGWVAPRRPRRRRRSSTMPTPRR